MVEITAQQLDGVLAIVSELDKVDLRNESYSLQDRILGATYTTRDTYSKRPPTRDEIDSAKKSAESKTRLGPYDFLIELAKTHTLLAVVLFVLVVVE